MTWATTPAGVVVPAHVMQQRGKDRPAPCPKWVREKLAALRQEFASGKAAPKKAAAK